MVESAHYRIWGETPQSAKGSEFHRVAQTFENDQVLIDVFARHDLVHELDAAGRADAARRAFPARFDRAEFHGETRLPRHVDRVVEDHDAAMADQPVAGGEGLVVERRVEQLAREVGAERTADLHGANRPPRAGAAADVIDERAERDAERGLVKAAVLDVAGKLNGHGAARLARAEIAIEGAALHHDDGHGRERQHVVDDGRLAEQTDMGRERRLGADLAPLAFEAVEKRGFLAANISACARAHFHVELVLRAGDAAPEHAALARLLDGDLHRRNRVGIFGADVDVAVGGADGDARDGHALDQNEGIAFHDHAVGEGAGIAFIGVADDVFLLWRRLGDGAPFDPGGEARAAAAAQARGDDLLDDRLRSGGNRLLQALIAAMRLVVFQAARIDDAATLEGEPRLALEPGIVLDTAD